MGYAPLHGSQGKFTSLGYFLTLNHRSGEYHQLNKNFRGMERQFNYICPDTFCEGEFGNLTSIDFVCSVDSEKETVAECLWQFAGSYEQVDPDTGTIDFHKKFFDCRFPVNTSVYKFLQFARKAGEPGAYGGIKGLLEASIPNTQKTMYDVLTDCL